MPISPRFMELLEILEDTHKRKNAGYSGKGNDPWLNFRHAELFGVSAFKGCLIRMSDKYNRIINLVKNPDNEQVGESIIDTLIDLASYALIAICLYEEENRKEKDNAGNVYTEKTNIENSDEYSETKILRKR